MLLLLLHVHRTLFAEKRESVAVFTLKMALDTISLSQLDSLKIEEYKNIPDFISE